VQRQVGLADATSACPPSSQLASPTIAAIHISVLMPARLQPDRIDEAIDQRIDNGR
jgi:hypothetical protein